MPKGLDYLSLLLICYLSSADPRGFFSRNSKDVNTHSEENIADGTGRTRAFCKTHIVVPESCCILPILDIMTFYDILETSPLHHRD